MATITQPRNTAHPASVAARRKTLDTTAKYVLLTLFTLTWLLPILATVLTSFRTMDDIAVNGFWSIPEKFTLEQFKAAWIAARVRQYLLNSFIITIPAGTLTAGDWELSGALSFSAGPTIGAVPYTASHSGPTVSITP
mgnify:CR=1 FL=1